jgi:hypothetical protein
MVARQGGAEGSERGEGDWIASPVNKMSSLVTCLVVIAILSSLKTIALASSPSPKPAGCRPLGLSKTENDGGGAGNNGGAGSGAGPNGLMRIT